MTYLTDDDEINVTASTEQQKSYVNKLRQLLSVSVLRHRILTHLSCGVVGKDVLLTALRFEFCVV